MSGTITIEAFKNAMCILAKNDVGDWDGRVYCYEWEVEKLLAGGVNPKHIAIIPNELPALSNEKENG